MSRYAALICIVLLVAACLCSLMLGAFPLSAASVVQALSGKGGEADYIIHEIRLPRTLLALVVGASLGFCGAAMQGYLRNPLAEPGLLGVSSGASLGAVLAFYTGFSAYAAYALPLSGMVGALLAALCVWALVGRTGGAHSFILAGMAVSSFAAAAVSVALNLSPNPFAVMEIIFWLLGSLSDRSMDDIWLISPFVLTGAVLIASSARALDALSLGEETAKSLGFSVKSVQMKLLFGASLMVGAIVSVTGVIGFVGLIVPHIMRPFAQHMPSRLLPLSAFAGAILVLLADMLVRIVPTSGTELKLGVITALIGAPFFLWVVLRSRGRVV